MLQDGIYIVDYPIVRESDNAVTVYLHGLRSSAVISGLPFVDCSIYLYDEPGFRAAKVSDGTPDGVLPPESQTVDLPLTNTLLQQGLRRGRFLPQFLCSPPYSRSPSHQFSR